MTCPICRSNGERAELEECYGVFSCKNNHHFVLSNTPKKTCVLQQIYFGSQQF